MRWVVYLFVFVTFVMHRFVYYVVVLFCVFPVASISAAQDQGKISEWLSVAWSL